MGCCVIMAGGRGTRFWPLSRTGRPKQLLPLAGKLSLLRQTYERVAPLVGPERVLVVTSGELAAPIREQLPEVPPAQVIAEPVGRNTAPCAVLGVGLAARVAPGEPVALLPADHAIGDDDLFRQQLAAAFAHAGTTDEVVTFGIVPTHPETGYGYLETGLEAGPGGFRAGLAFVEKPDRARAEAYLRGGRHFWNSGIFVWGADTFRAAATAHVPQLAAALEPVLAAWGSPIFMPALAAAYAQCPAVSIDVAVMEKLARFAVLPARFGWSDLGSWSAWRELAPALGDDNRGVADLVAVESRANVVHAPGKLVALIGVQGLVVVDTGDALLICPAAEDQRVKDIIGRLEAAGRTDVL
jgi:mannose-1-phosphate guanylyltransferase